MIRSHSPEVELSPTLAPEASASRALVVLLVLLALAFGRAQAQGYSETTLYSFAGSPDGSDPQSTLVIDAQRNLYGTTLLGGEFGSGTIFKLDASGNETVLYSFGATQGDGIEPAAGLMIDAQGNLYGTTVGGRSCNGTVFKFDPKTGEETRLHCFRGETDGRYPHAALIRDSQGNLYGTTAGGGNREYCSGQGCGTVFKIGLANHEVVETVLYAFTGINGDGASPIGRLLLDTQGNLYGTTQIGGSGWGTVFKLDPNGEETILHAFADGPEGVMPQAGLVMDAQGNLYGTTYYGAKYGCTANGILLPGCGALFKVDPNGNEGVVYSFVGPPTDGGNSYADVLLDAKGNLYGTTQFGGEYNSGTAFVVDKAGREAVLFSFNGGPDATGPQAGLVRDSLGNLYGDDPAISPLGNNGFVLELSPP